MCSFTVLVGGGSENQSVSGVTTICLTQCNTSPSHRVDQVVVCGLWNVAPLLFNGCVKLLDIDRNWNTLSYTLIQSIPNMLNEWHVRWVCWPYKNWDVFSFQELCTDTCNMRPCIIMLQHEVMVVGMNGTTMGLRISSWYLCIQNAINKMHLCSLSITYACPYHNPTTTIVRSIQNVDISKPLTHMMPYTLSTICPIQWKPGFILEENTSPKCQTPSNVSIIPLKSVTTTNCSQVETPMRKTSFPETVSDSLCRNSLIMQTDCCSMFCSMIVADCLDVLPNSLKCLWRRLMVEKWTFNSTALVDIPAVSMPIARSLKTCDICGIVLCDKTAHFIVASLRHTCAINMLPNQHLDMPPVRWMDYQRRSAH